MLTIAQAAETLKLHPVSVRRLINAGKLRAVNVSRGQRAPRWRVTQDAIDEFATENTADIPAAEPVPPRRRGSEADNYV